MPRLDNLPSLEIIRGLKGILDFYYWKGIPCVRKWPVIPPASRTPASLASAALFGAVVQGYSLLGGVLKLLFSEDAADQPRTTRDLYVSAALGHLHEINMDEVIALLEQNNAYLLALQDVLNTLNSIATDSITVRPAFHDAAWHALLVDDERHLHVDVIESGLPEGAATAAHQVTQNTALALIQKLETTLESVATDRLIVRGEDQLFTFHSVVALRFEDNPSDADGYIASSGVPEGSRWVITNIVAFNNTTACSQIRFAVRHDTNFVDLKRETKAFGIAESLNWSGHTYMHIDDTIEAWFIDSLITDTCYLAIIGYQLTVEL